MTEKIEQIIKTEIESSGASFIGVELRGRPGTFRLSVFVDTESGISLGECTRISKKLIVLPELEKLLGDRFRLEVSSPGIDRPLKTVDDFKRKIGLDLDIKIIQQQKEKRIKGKLLNVTDEFLFLNSSGEELKIRFDQVVKAFQALPW